MTCVDEPGLCQTANGLVDAFATVWSGIKLTFSVLYVHYTGHPH